MGYIKFIESGGILEVYEYENEVSKHTKNKRKSRFQRGIVKIGYIRPSNARRRTLAFTRLVRANLSGEERPVLLTLTHANIPSYERAIENITLFFKRLRAYCGRSFRYIAVPEFQKRGSIHFHAIVWGIDRVITDNEQQNRYLQNIWQRGYLDCIITDGSPKLASYLSKYLSKGLLSQRIGSKKGYFCSRNIMRPVCSTFAATALATEEIWGLDLSTAVPCITAHMSSKWLGKGRYRLYKLGKK